MLFQRLFYLTFFKVLTGDLKLKPQITVDLVNTDAEQPEPTFGWLMLPPFLGYLLSSISHPLVTPTSTEFHPLLFQSYCKCDIIWGELFNQNIILIG